MEFFGSSKKEKKDELTTKKEKSDRSKRTSNRPPAGEETSSQPWKERFRRMFETYDPSQLKKLDDMMSIASGREDQILAALVKRYGPEPPAAPVNTSPSPPVERAAAVPKVLDVTPTDDGEPLSYETRFRRIFEHYDTSQLPKLPELMRMSKGREGVLLNSLVKRYGPEPKSQVVSGKRDEAKPKDIASTNSVAAFDSGQPLHPPLVQLASSDSNVMPLSASSAAGGTSPTFDQSRDRCQSVSTTYDDPPSATRIGNGQQDQRSSSVISDPFDIDVNTSPTVSVAHVESPLGQTTYVVNVPSTTFDGPFSEDHSRGNVNDVSQMRNGDQHDGRQSFERGNHYERAPSDSSHRSEASQHPRAVPRAVQYEEPSHRNTPHAQTRSRDAANTKPPQWEEYWDDSVASARDIEEDLRSVARSTSHYGDVSPTHIVYDRRGPDAPYNDKQPHRHGLEVAHSAPAAVAPPPAFWGSEMAYMLSELRLLREQVTLQAKDIKQKDEELYQLRATVVGLRTALEVMQRPSGPIPLSTMAAMSPVVRSSSSSIREASFDPFEDSPPRRPSTRDVAHRVEYLHTSPDAQLQRQPSASAVSTHVSRGSVLTPYVTATVPAQPITQTAQQLPAIGSNRSSPRRYENNTEPSPPPSARSNVSFRQPVDDSAGPHLENPLRGISSAKLQSSMSPVRRYRQNAPLHNVDAPSASREAVPVRYSSHKDASVFPTMFDGVPQEYLPHSPLAMTALGSYYQPQDSSPMSQLLW